MISTIKPFGSFADRLAQYRFTQDGKYYVVDEEYNQYQIEESEYMALKCPIRKITKKVRLKQ